MLTGPKDKGDSSMPKDAHTPAEFAGATVVLGVPTRARKKRPVRNEAKRLHARAINRILDKETGELVGWLYEWNTGERVPRWKANAVADVIYD